MFITKLNLDNKDEVVKYLIEVQNDFKPSLFERIKNRSNVSSIERYAKKILRNANVFVYKDIDKKEIIALIAIYTNDITNFEAYIPFLSVHVDWIGKGLASRLLEHSIHTAKNNGMKIIKLRTWNSNSKAIALYTKFGFKINYIDELNVMFIKEIL